MRLLILLASLLVGPAAGAQIVVSTTSFQTSATATTGPGSCTDSAGGVGVGEAIAFCSDPKGNTAAASSQAGVTASTSGGSVFVDAEAAASSTGIPPFEQPSGNATSNSIASWILQTDDFHYSLSLGAAGGAFVSFSGGSSGTLPPSGILSPDIYSLNASGSASAVAMDVNGAETVTAIPQRVDARVSFATVGSTSLILGFVLAGGVGQPGLRVEALDSGAAVVASTSTGDDGSYLLPDLVGPVSLRASDPDGNFASEISSPLAPPASLDFDLSPIVQLPALQAPTLVLLCLLIAWVGATELKILRPQPIRSGWRRCSF